ncbi:progranulin-like [Rhipicephalus microplus]|uniref:progranulin-like n=1 Tax=Rhipicephalus microplus TaxID=6941 RepID=UPI003F6CFAF7
MLLLPLGFLLLSTSAALAPDYKRCPDGSLCHKTGTCCLLPVGRYSCCTLTNAVCCSARSSCCPEHYICDEASNLCAPAGAARKHSEGRNATKTTIAAKATTASKYTVDDEELLMTKCPAGDTYCFRDNSTCCRQESGSYGCCPDRDAVCCSDLVNCCPRGFTCISGTGNCVQTTSIAKLGAAASARRTALRTELAGSDIPGPLPVAAMRVEQGHTLP